VRVLGWSTYRRCGGAPPHPLSSFADPRSAHLMQPPIAPASIAARIILPARWWREMCCALSAGHASMVCPAVSSGSPHRRQAVLLLLPHLCRLCMVGTCPHLHRRHNRSCTAVRCPFLEMVPGGRVQAGCSLAFQPHVQRIKVGPQRLVHVAGQALQRFSQIGEDAPLGTAALVACPLWPSCLVC
jgi:hypothetical protein